MCKILLLLSIFMLFTPSIIRCDITNLNDFFRLLKQNSTINYPMGFLSKGNVDVAKRYLRDNINVTIFNDKEHLLKAIDDEIIIAGVTTGQAAQDLEPKYHVFSSLIISPQAILIAPEYNEKITPYGLKDQSTNDLYDALNAAIADVQRDDIDETLLTNSNLTDLVRVYTCHQASQLPVVNRNDTTGILHDILFNKTKLLIGGYGPKDWGIHDGNYKINVSNGFYPKLLDAIVDKLGKLKGPDGIVYSEKIEFERKFFDNMTALFKALLDGKVHATDVYVLIDAPYTGTGENCTNNEQCRARESCLEGVCTHPERPRSLHFRTTCATASRDTKFITKKNSQTIKFDSETNDNTRQTPKTRWIGFLLLFVTFFATIFVILLIMIRRKKYYRIEHTLPGGFGKFARLQEESEPPMEGMDAFDDHIVQSPRDNTNSTT